MDVYKHMHSFISLYCFGRENVISLLTFYCAYKWVFCPSGFLFQCACVPLGFCPVRFCPSGFYKLSYTRLKLFPFLGGGSVAVGSLCCLWGFCVGLCFVMHFFVSFLVLQSS